MSLFEKISEFELPIYAVSVIMDLTEEFGLEVMPYTCIREVLGSNTCLVAGNPV
jgi:hypothetical protein